MIKYIITFICFLVIDLIWIGLVAQPLYKKQLPAEFMAEPPRFLYAGLFYILFTFALYFLFINNATEINKELLIKVFLFGLTSYGTFSLTNMAVIKDWNLAVTIPDLLWGGLLSTAVTVVTLLISKGL